MLTRYVAVFVRDVMRYYMSLCNMVSMNAIRCNDDDVYSHCASCIYPINLSADKCDNLILSCDIYRYTRMAAQRLCGPPVTDVRRR